MYERKRSEDCLNDKNVVTTVKQSVDLFLVWGCFGGETAGDLIRVNGIRNKVQ